MFALLFVIACGSSEPDPAAASAAKNAPAAPAAVESAALTVAASSKATEALAVPPMASRTRWLTNARDARWAWTEAQSTR